MEPIEQILRGAKATGYNDSLLEVSVVLTDKYLQIELGYLGSMRDNFVLYALDNVVDNRDKEAGNSLATESVSAQSTTAELLSHLVSLIWYMSNLVPCAPWRMVRYWVSDPER